MRKRAEVDVENAKITPRTEYVAVLGSISKGKFCPFCEKHLMKHHKKPILFKNAHWLATENSWPYEGTKHHFVLIARKHVEDVSRLSPKAWESLGSAVKRLVKEYGLKGGTLLIRSGDTGHTGASVSHLHAQFIVGGKRGKSTEELRAVVGFKKKK